MRRFFCFILFLFFCCSVYADDLLVKAHILEHDKDHLLVNITSYSLTEETNILKYEIAGDEYYFLEDVEFQEDRYLDIKEFSLTNASSGEYTFRILDENDGELFFETFILEKEDEKKEEVTVVDQETPYDKKNTIEKSSDETTTPESLVPFTISIVFLGILLVYFIVLFTLKHTIKNLVKKAHSHIDKGEVHHAKKVYHNINKVYKKSHKSVKRKVYHHCSGLHKRIHLETKE